MKANSIKYLLKEGVRGIFVHGFMSFAAVCVTVACLLIVGSFSCLMFNVNDMVQELNKTNEILVYVDMELPEADAKSVGTQINRIGNVHNAVFVSREEAMENFIATQDNAAAFSGMYPEDFPHRFVVTLEDNNLLQQTKESILKIPGVDSISAADEVAEGFATIQNVLRIASVVVISVLLMVSLLIISNTVKLAMYDRKDEIAIMKMVGATNGFIRLPFVVEGFILGMLGAGLAFGLQWLTYDALAAQIARDDTLKNLFTPVPFTQPELLWLMVAVFVAAGLFVGVVGSWTSIRKFMDV